MIYPMPGSSAQLGHGTDEMLLTTGMLLSFALTNINIYIYIKEL